MSTPQGPPAAPDGDAPSRVFRVVVADDAAGIRALLRTLLSLEPDFDVVGLASDGAQAVDLVKRLQPDLVVIDVAMPVMSGLEAIAAIRELSPEIRIAVLSGERREIPDGAHALIEKGTSNEVLVGRLRKLCQRD